METAGEDALSCSPVGVSAEDAVKALLWCVEGMQQLQSQCSQEQAALLGQTLNMT